MTFRETVEEIQACNDWRHCKVRGKMCYECRIDRILAAYKEAVEGMPQIPRKYIRPDGCWGYDFSEEREAGAEKQLEACKEHLLKEAGE